MPSPELARIWSRKRSKRLLTATRVELVEFVPFFGAELIKSLREEYKHLGNFEISLKAILKELKVLFIPIGAE